MECVSLCQKDDNCGAFQWNEPSHNACTLMSKEGLFCDKDKLDSTEVFITYSSNSIFTCHGEYITIYYVSRFLTRSYTFLERQFGVRISFQKTRNIKYI